MERVMLYRVPVVAADVFAELAKVFWADHSAHLYHQWNYTDGERFALFAFLSDHPADHAEVGRIAESLGGGVVF